MTIRELVFALVAAFVAALVTDIFADWSSNLSKWLVRWAAARLPSEVAIRCEEEWLSTVHTRARLLQPFFALDLFRASYRINHDRRRLGLSNTQRRFPKRFFDIAVSFLMLLCVFPLLALIGIMVKVSSPGPMFFTQRRYGLDGREIAVYKFRTMRVTEDGAQIRQASGVDSRLTRIGPFLRRASLDELPQLINVLQGRMSLVGPRPRAAAPNDMFKELFRKCNLTERVLPSLTGWAQINGLHGETGTIEQFERRLRYDLDYIQHRSFWLDIRIVIATALAAFSEDPHNDWTETVSPKQRPFGAAVFQRVLHMFRRLLRRADNESDTRD